MPPLSERIKSYREELKKWEDAGKPLRSKGRIEEIFNTYCKKCEFLTTQIRLTICDRCGCFINQHQNLNKIAFATTRCPLEQPKWIEEINELEQEKNIGVEEEKPQTVEFAANHKSIITGGNGGCCYQ